METLKETLLRVMAGYAGEALNGDLYLTTNEDAGVYVVVGIADDVDERVVDAGLVVRLAQEKIVIEYDGNDKPLYKTLIQAGIPRAQIILAYVGERMEAVKS